MQMDFKTQFLGLTFLKKYFSHLRIFIFTNLSITFFLFSNLSYAAKFENIRPLLFQVKTISPGQEEKRSYGTGFIVAKDGLIATNFHVVADHIWKPKKFKIVIDDAGQNKEAQVVALDIVNDLALIKVDMEFKKILPIAPNKIRQGQEAFSYGLPEDLDWTIVRGIYNGILEQGPYRSIHLSSPLNRGMSGGPTTNSKGEVIGINSAGRTNSQEISFAVPSEYLVQLIQDYRKTTQLNSLQVIEKQSQSLQNKMTQTLLKGLANKKKFNTVQIPKFDKSLRCWGDSSGSDNENSLVVKNREICVVENSLFIDGERSFGTLRAEFQLDENRKLNSLAWAHYKSQNFSNTDQFVRFSIKDSVINFNEEKCLRKNVVKTNDVPIVFASCVQKITPFKDLYDVYLFYQHSIDINRNLKAQFMLSGFNQENIQKITEALLKYNFSPGAQ